MNKNEDLALELLQGLKRLKRLSVQQNGGCNLTPAQIGILHALCYGHGEQEEGISVRQLSESTRQTPSSITQFLNVLEKEELVERRIDPDDRRVIRVRMTAKGRSIVGKYRKKLLDLSTGIVESVGPEKIALFVSVLEDVAGYIEHYERNQTSE